MKSKFVIALGVIVLTLGIGTAAYAAGEGQGLWASFQDMLPHMRAMHPDLSDRQLEDMYQSCHGNSGQNERGMMRSGNAQSGGMMQSGF
ncbi:CUE domain-containing protein [Paenibacillus sp. GM2]|uniref:CUE domain-containing protein n=1 Tax=Paenibacillus sp. GM2 TaxID=1622070 RepID=UPI0008394816|nr:CUE domain-containing protein [Paenibacillus sp. GM2]